ncbi:hypothetical protein ACWFMI_23375 [Nocardiopsis terrae]|uniref:hypothetical protein n=1 Tax=Streptomyces sp. NPDC057554 TaxID=3350538 RepID=UPI0036B5366C
MFDLEERHYTPREDSDDPVTTTCVYEVDRLGTTQECGLALAEDADLDQLFCPSHDLDVSAGRISWQEYRTYQNHYQRP